MTAQVAPSDDSPRALSPMRVLVVDDNAINREVASSMLEWWGVDVVVAADGAEAVQFVLRGVEFDLVLMDLQMPVMDGLTATKAIRQFELRPNGPSHRVPIVAWTATTILEGVTDLQQVGLDAVLAKPVSNDAMSACLERWCPDKFQPS